MIYIFDTTHETQINDSFKKDLEQFIYNLKIEVIAEEVDDNNGFNGIISCAYEYHLNKSDIQYVNIEDKNLHIKVPDSYIMSCPIEKSMQKHLFEFYQSNFNTRENHWLSKILPYESNNLLLIIGAAHFESFTKKLDNSNIKWIRLDSYSIIPTTQEKVLFIDYKRHPKFSYIYE